MQNDGGLVPKKRLGGFTLVEAMITVAILAILASIALPSYWGHMNKSRRVDATHTLIDYATKQELYYSRHGSYASAISTGGLNLKTKSTEEYYDISVGKCRSETDYSICYRLVAKANSSGPQANDSECQTFILKSNGRKSAKDSSGNNSNNCW